MVPIDRLVNIEVSSIVDTLSVIANTEKSYR